jgi:hypothetical protein
LFKRIKAQRVLPQELRRNAIMSEKEVNRFRVKYRKIEYSCDSIKEKKADPAKAKKLKN